MDFSGGRGGGIEFRERESILLPISARIGEGVAGTLDFPKYFDKKFNIGVAGRTPGPNEIIHDCSYLKMRLACFEYTE